MKLVISPLDSDDNRMIHFDALYRIALEKIDLPYAKQMAIILEKQAHQISNLMNTLDLDETDMTTVASRLKLVWGNYIMPLRDAIYEVEKNGGRFYVVQVARFIAAADAQFRGLKESLELTKIEGAKE